MNEEEVLKEIAHLFDEPVIDFRPVVEESDELAKLSSLAMLKLCGEHKVNDKSAMDLLNHAETELKRELSEGEVKFLFFEAFRKGMFSKYNEAPNGWKSFSAIEQIEGKQYSKGFED